MATPDEGVERLSPNIWHEVDVPPFRKEIVDLKFVNISIKCYEKKIGTGFKEEYYAYKIVSILTSSDERTGDRQRYEVWRRYSEFETLKNFLISIYPHVVIPPLPVKAIKGSSGLLSKITFSGEDNDFLLQRQQALEIFLVRLSRHRLLSKNFWFHEFLQKIGWKERLMQSGFSGKGESMIQTLSMQLSKHTPDSRFQEVKAYGHDLESVLKAILNIRERLNGNMKAMYKVHGNFSRVFSEMCVDEKSLGNGFQIASGCLDSYGDSVDYYLVEEESRFLLPLKEYIGFCDSLRSVVRRHEVLQKQLEKSEENLSSKAEQKESLQKNAPEDGSSGGKKLSLKNISALIRGEDTRYEVQLANADKELSDAEETVDQSQKEFEQFTEDSLQELEKFSHQKDGDFRSMLINYVQLQMHMHRKGMTTWQKIQKGFTDTS